VPDLFDVDEAELAANPALVDSLVLEA
jgi:hypothetical protein